MFKTLAYADIFDYPLTLEETKKWLIKGDAFVPGKESPDWNYLPGRAELVRLRQRREQSSRKKLANVKKLAMVFRLIPFIKLVCITGALAMNNADKNDDIDLMVVTARNRLWLTRLITSLLLFPWLRRGQKINNRLCLNLWLDESALAIKSRNLYIAHEICQAKPIFERGNTYQKFIRANLWYKQFLPNWKI